MKNIFKENKKLKEENNKLKIKVNELQKENTDGLLRMQEYYEKVMNKKIEYLEVKYKTKMERKKEVLKICKELEKKLITNITSLIDLDITTDINAYLKLLDYLKGEEKLQLKYKNLIVEVNYKDIRKYEIVIKLEYKGVTYESKFEYLYNAKLTLDANISIIENIIDSKIILPFYKKGE